ncbi:hypothetical protein AMS68_006739 [Peltaster fructicola]|uniref:Protein ARV n=1 Tax=Peltaster fructicola TaxID=286661 RepID=A0A6H0Y2H5_9PEZI|nr:hypothetical protein AMS68_006739 [Peltaster fructicola]
MPICIECRYPISTLYTTYSKADDKTLGKGVRLTHCLRCHRVADKYVEHDFVVLFIDLVLIKPQVYRHLLFNRLGREDGRFDPSMFRLGVLLLLFDVYLTWARIEKASTSSLITPPPSGIPSAPSIEEFLNSTTSIESSERHANALSSQPIFLQYLFFLALCTIETISFHVPIRTLLAAPLPWPISIVIPHYQHPSLVSTALLVSSFTKLFPLLLLVWNYDLPSSASAVSWAVIINNIAALEILLNCGYGRAIVLAAIGAICRAGAGWGILSAVGINGGMAAAGVVETGDVIEIWKSFAENVGLG